jgi:hypothetical protein
MATGIVLKPILPKKAFDDKGLMNKLASEVERYGPEMKRDFVPTTQNWKAERPVFDVRFERKPRAFISSVSVVAGSVKGVQKWTWLNYGTKHNYPIRPKRGRFLAFPGGQYHAGSSPNSLRTSSAGFTPTGQTVFRKVVIHPGIQARNWLGLIKKKHEPLFKAWMNGAMTRAVYMSGYLIKG